MLSLLSLMSPSVLWRHLRTTTRLIVILQCPEINQSFCDCLFQCISIFSHPIYQPHPPFSKSSLLFHFSKTNPLTPTLFLLSNLHSLDHHLLFQLVPLQLPIWPCSSSLCSPRAVLLTGQPLEEIDHVIQFIVETSTDPAFSADIIPKFYLNASLALWYVKRTKTLRWLAVQFREIFDHTLGRNFCCLVGFFLNVLTLLRFTFIIRIFHAHEAPIILRKIWAIAYWSRWHGRILNQFPVPCKYS